MLQKALVGEAVQTDVVHLDAMHGDQGTVGTDQRAEGDGGAGGLVNLGFKAPADVLDLQVHLQVVEGGFEKDGTGLAPLGQSHLLDQFFLVGTGGAISFAVPPFEPFQPFPVLVGECGGQGAEAVSHAVHRGNALAFGGLGAAGLAAIVAGGFGTGHCELSAFGYQRSAGDGEPRSRAQPRLAVSVYEWGKRK